MAEQPLANWRGRQQEDQRQQGGETQYHRRSGANDVVQLPAIVMMLGYQLSDAVKYPGPRQYAKYGHQLAEVTRLPYPCRAERHGQQLNHQQTGADFDQRGRRGPQRRFCQRHIRRNSSAAS